METVGIEPTICSHCRSGRNDVKLLPLHDRSGAVIAKAIVDDGRDDLVLLRWYLDRPSLTRTGPAYVRRTVDPLEPLQRVVLGLKPGDKRKVDHIDGNTLDNRRANLRIVTDAENAQNQGSRGGSSRYRGVTWDRSRGRWMASHMLNGRRTTIGRYATEDEAGRAAAAWRAEHMPFSSEAAA